MGRRRASAWERIATLFSRDGVYRWRFTFEDPDLADDDQWDHVDAPSREAAILQIKAFGYNKTATENALRSLYKTRIRRRYRRGR